MQYLCHNQFTFCFPKWIHYIKKHLIDNFARFTLINTICIVPLLSISMLKIKCNYVLTTYIKNCKSLFQQIFIVYKTFTLGIKTKNLSRTTRFCLWSFYKGVLKDNHLTRWPVFNGPNSGCLIQAWLQIFNLTWVKLLLAYLSNEIIEFEKFKQKSKQPLKKVF